MSTEEKVRKLKWVLAAQTARFFLRRRRQRLVGVATTTETIKCVRCLSSLGSYTGCFLVCIRLFQHCVVSLATSFWPKCVEKLHFIHFIWALIGSVRNTSASPKVLFAFKEYKLRSHSRSTNPEKMARDETSRLIVHRTRIKCSKGINLYDSVFPSLISI